MKVILNCEGIGKQVISGEERKSILKNIRLEIKPGEFVSIMGASGAGKSTLLYILGLMDRPDDGRIYIEAEDVLKLGEDKLSYIRRDVMGFVFQSYNLVTSLTAIDNILLPSYIKDNKRLRAEKYERARELLDHLGLGRKAKQRVIHLSGGEQQRIAIGRALINEPKIVLMDEPTGNLDSQNGVAIMDLVARINREKQIAFLQVTHSNDYAEYGSRILYMRDGEIYDEATVSRRRGE